MLSKLYTATLQGLDCKIVEVEVDYRRGNTAFFIVGLADKSIQEAKERIPSAIKNSGASFIPMVIIANLAPAELNKTGPSYDLPLAVGYLLSSEQINIDTKDKIFIGELALDGRLRPVHGILPIADAAKKLGFKEIYLPKDNAKEAALVKGIDIYALEKLEDLIKHFNEIELLKPYQKDVEPIQQCSYSFNLAQVKGQKYAKRALEIAAAGGHNILMSGTPGSGKTMITRCLPSILPQMTLEESLEVTRIHSIAGIISNDNPMIQERPFRSPHHTSSQVALVGGGSIPKPGEISLAHRGVLFLDEFPEFSHHALEALRQPLEDKVVTISRSAATLTFPASFILAAAMNPCKCGYKGDPIKQCNCTAHEALRYRKRISGPILDRIDLLINVPKVEYKDLISNEISESSETVQLRVQKARDIQTQRFTGANIFCNSEMNQTMIDKFIKLDNESRQLINFAVRKMNLSARSYFRILKIARTIADLNLIDQVSEQNIAEALSFRVEISS